MTSDKLTPISNGTVIPKLLRDLWRLLTVAMIRIASRVPLSRARKSNSPRLTPRNTARARLTRSHRISIGMSSFCPLRSISVRVTQKKEPRISREAGKGGEKDIDQAPKVERETVRRGEESCNTSPLRSSVDRGSVCPRKFSERVRHVSLVVVRTIAVRGRQPPRRRLRPRATVTNGDTSVVGRGQAETKRKPAEG
jgi:hypothetical protein